jgi:hypothetical protein
MRYMGHSFMTDLKLIYVIRKRFVSAALDDTHRIHTIYAL